jgi:hypothetical protein
MQYSWKIRVALVWKIRHFEDSVSKINQSFSGDGSSRFMRNILTTYMTVRCHNLEVQNFYLHRLVSYFLGSERPIYMSLIILILDDGAKDYIRNVDVSFNTFR